MLNKISLENNYYMDGFIYIWLTHAESEDR